MLWSSAFGMPADAAASRSFFAIAAIASRYFGSPVDSEAAINPLYKNAPGPYAIEVGLRARKLPVRDLARGLVDRRGGQSRRKIGGDRAGIRRRIAKVARLCPYRCRPAAPGVANGYFCATLESGSKHQRRCKATLVFPRCTLITRPFVTGRPVDIRVIGQFNLAVIRRCKGNIINFQFFASADMSRIRSLYMQVLQLKFSSGTDLYASTSKAVFAPVALIFQI